MTETHGNPQRGSGVPLTAVEGASPADGLAWSVGVRGGGGDQVVVHVAVEAWLLSRGFLLHLSDQTPPLLTELKESGPVPNGGEI